MSKKLEKSVEIVNKKGLHARAAAKFVKLANAHDGAHVEVCKDGNTVDGRSIMGLLMLAAATHSKILIRTDGKNAQKALDALADLVIRGFDE
jgi:phosphocarrier protein